jgi:hypothetical protein
MTDDGGIVGGTPGAQWSPEDRYFDYSEDAWNRIERALGRLTSDHRWEIRFIATGFMMDRTRKEQFDVKMRRHAHHLGIADAAQRLLDATSAEGRQLDPLMFRDGLREQLEELAQFHRGLARHERGEAPHNATKPDRGFLLYRLCSFWERTTGSAPVVAFRQKLSGNYLVGEKYGPAVDFLIAAGTEPCLLKSHKAVTPDVAAAAISAYNDPETAAAIDHEYGKAVLDDLVDPLAPAPDMEE